MTLGKVRKKCIGVRAPDSGAAANSFCLASPKVLSVRGPSRFHRLLNQTSPQLTSGCARIQPAQHCEALLDHSAMAHAAQLDHMIVITLLHAADRPQRRLGLHSCVWVTAVNQVIELPKGCSCQPLQGHFGAPQQLDTAMHMHST